MVDASPCVGASPGPHQLGRIEMIRKSLRSTALLGAVCFFASTASAAVVERSCTCQGYARTFGLQTANNNYVEDAHKAAVYYCETGTRHAYARAAGGTYCTPAACPSGTIDLGIVVQNCRGILKSRYTPGTAISNNFAPAEAGCNYDSSAAEPADRFVSCDLECDRVRQCATASDN